MRRREGAARYRVVPRLGESAGAAPKKGSPRGGDSADQPRADIEGRRSSAASPSKIFLPPLTAGGPSFLQRPPTFGRVKVCRWRSSAVERLICNQRVGGSIPSASSNRLSPWDLVGVDSAERHTESRNGEVAKRPNATDCKSVAPRASKVRILPSPPFFWRGREADGVKQTGRTRRE